MLHTGCIYDKFERRVSANESHSTNAHSNQDRVRLILLDLTTQSSDRKTKTWQEHHFMPFDKSIEIISTVYRQIHKDCELRPLSARGGKPLEHRIVALFKLLCSPPTQQAATLTPYNQGFDNS